MESRGDLYSSIDVDVALGLYRLSRRESAAHKMVDLLLKTKGLSEDFYYVLNFFKTDEEQVKRLGDLYYNGLNGIRDYEKAIECYKLCNSDLGYERIADCYLNNLVHTDNRVEESLGWYSKIEDKNRIIDAADKYLIGDGKPKNPEYGLQLLLLSDNPDIQEWVGDQYYLGEIVEKDDSKSLDAYYKSSINGNDELCKKIIDHLFDIGLYKDCEKFVELLAKKNYADAQYLMGLLNDGTYGIKDIEKAYYYFEMAANAGDKDAKENADALQKNIDWEQYAYRKEHGDLK